MTPRRRAKFNTFRPNPPAAYHKATGPQPKRLSTTAGGSAFRRFAGRSAEPGLSEAAAGDGSQSAEEWSEGHRTADALRSGRVRAQSRRGSRGRAKTRDAPARP